MKSNALAIIAATYLIVNSQNIMAKNDFLGTVVYCAPTVKCVNNNCQLSQNSPFNVRTRINNPGAPDGTYYFWQADTDGFSNGGNCLYIGNSDYSGTLIGFSRNPIYPNLGANVLNGNLGNTVWYQHGNTNLQCAGHSPSDAYKCSWNLLGND